MVILYRIWLLCKSYNRCFDDGLKPLLSAPLVNHHSLQTHLHAFKQQLPPPSPHNSLFPSPAEERHRPLLLSRSGRHCCPKAESSAQGWVWASASSPPCSIFKQMPASENIPHCHWRGGGLIFSLGSMLMSERK